MLLRTMLASVLSFVLAAPASADLTTTFAGGNGLSSPPDAVFWDLQTTTSGITITGFDTNTDAALGDPFTVDVYFVVGGYSGNETNLGAWTLAATGIGTGNGTGNTVDNVVLSNSFSLAAGTTYGMAMVYNGPGGVNYTNGAAGTPFVGSDGVTLFTGVSQSTAFTSTTIADRQWNGTIYYSASAIPEPSSLALLGVAGIGLVVRRRRR